MELADVIGIDALIAIDKVINDVGKKYLDDEKWWNKSKDEWVDAVYKKVEKQNVDNLNKEILLKRIGNWYEFDAKEIIENELKKKQENDDK